MGWLDHVVILFLIFFKELHTLFHMVEPIYMPTNSKLEFPFPHILAKLVISCHFYNSLINMRWYFTVVLICKSNYEWCWAPLHTSWPLGCLLAKMSIDVLSPFLNLIVWSFCYWVVWVPHIFLDINPSYVVWKFSTPFHRLSFSWLFLLLWSFLI